MWLSAAAAFIAVCAYYMNYNKQLREAEEDRSVFSECPSLLQLYSRGLLLEACRQLSIDMSSGSRMGW